MAYIQKYNMMHVQIIIGIIEASLSEPHTGEFDGWVFSVYIHTSSPGGLGVIFSFARISHVASAIRYSLFMHSYSRHLEWNLTALYLTNTFVTFRTCAHNHDN